MPSVRGVWRGHVAHRDALDDIRAVSCHARGVLWGQETLHPPARTAPRTAPLEWRVDPVRSYGHGPILRDPDCGYGVHECGA